MEQPFEIRAKVRENLQSRGELAAIGITPERVTELLRTSSRAWVAEVEGKAVAFSMANAAERTVFAMIVRPAYEAVAWVGCSCPGRAWLFAQGLDEIWLTTGADPSLRANGFYRRLGWTEAGSTESGELEYLRRRAPT